MRICSGIIRTGPNHGRECRNRSTAFSFFCRVHRFKKKGESRRLIKGAIYGYDEKGGEEKGREVEEWQYIGDFTQVGEEPFYIREGKGKACYLAHGSLVEEWKGEWKGDKKCGPGILTTDLGEIEGDWDGDEVKGTATFRKYNGTVFRGEMIGDIGKYRIADGYGVMIYSDGKYEGEWKNGLRWGQGVCEMHGKHQVYRGEWERDGFNGYGELTDEKSRRVYKGNFVMGRISGMGMMEFPDGRFIGEWNNPDVAKGMYETDLWSVECDMFERQTISIPTGNINRNIKNNVLNILSSFSTISKYLGQDVSLMVFEYLLRE